MRHRPIAAAAVAGLGLFLLAGCQTGSEDPATTPEPSVPSSRPTETAEPTETTEPSEPAASVVNGPNSITAPEPGATVTGPAVAVTGEGTAFEATLSYQVLRAGTDDVVSEGWTTAGANGEIGPYSIELTLDPGEYTVQVWEPDVSDGESPDGPFRNLVEVTFTVA